MGTETGCVIVAAGRGTRAGGTLPKQYQDLAGQPMLSWTYARFAGHPSVGPVVVVIHPDDDDLAEKALPSDAIRVHGGADRAASVAAGLGALPEGCTRVLVQDGARPATPSDVIDRVLAALEDGPGAAPALAVTDALWRGVGPNVDVPVPRSGLYRAQTPQGFDLDALRAAHAAHPEPAADDVEVALAAGLPVTIVEGHEDNIKVTHPEDFSRAERLLSSLPSIRIGNGYDVHRFGPGDHVVLCGIAIPHEAGLVGHSDADVGMHALTDAIYGALAEGDIGRHFPPSDPQWKGAASDIFLEHAGKLASERGYRIGNADVTLVCEFPKIGPHAGKMQDRLSAILGLEPGRISVKATTSERLGFTGRGEGIAALATCTLERV